MKSWNKLLSGGAVAVMAFGFASLPDDPGGFATYSALGNAAYAQNNQNRAGATEGSGGTATSGTAGPSSSSHGAGGTNAGAGDNSGGQGNSTGPGGVNQNRFGGAESDEPPAPPPGDDEDLASDSTFLESVGGGIGGEDLLLGRGDRCADYDPAQMSPNRRLSGRNLERLNIAQVYLAPEFSPESFRSPIYILANYQEALEQSAVDTATAGTYVGIIATRPVSTDVIDTVNTVLCVTTSEQQANAIADQARIVQAGRR